MASFDLIGIGNTTQDFLGVVDRLPSKPDEGAPLRDFTVQGGGVVATAMVAAARLGLKVAHVDAIGDDEIGRQVLADLEVEGVSTEFMQIVSGATTPRCIVLVHRPTGKRSLLCNPGNAHEHFKELPPGVAEAVREAWGLHVFQPRQRVIRQAVEIAHEACTKVSFDSADAGEEAFETFRLGDVLIAPENWPANMDSADPESALRAAHDRGVRSAVVTMGENGCVGIENGGSPVRVPAFDVDVVDTTGAGDTFHGAYMAAWRRGYDFESRLRYASGASAMKCRSLGGRAGIPKHDDLVRFLKTRGVALSGAGRC